MTWMLIAVSVGLGALSSIVFAIIWDLCQEHKWQRRKK